MVVDDAARDHPGRRPRADRRPTGDRRRRRGGGPLPASALAAAPAARMPDSATARRASAPGSRVSARSCVLSLASLLVTSAAAPTVARRIVAWRPVMAALEASFAARQPARRGAHARLSVADARSTLLDAREKAGLSSAEFRACEAAT